MASSTSFCETKGEMSHYRYKWRIHDFALQMQKLQLCKSGISSSLFTIDDCKGSWRIQLYLKRTESEEFLIFQLFSTLKREPYLREAKFFMIKASGTKVPLLGDTSVEGDEVCSVGYISSQRVLENERCLPNGALTIECSIKVLNNTKTLATSESAQLIKSDSTLSRDVASVFDKMKFGDVTLVVGEKELQAHKIILAARSSVFRAMFEQKMREKEQSKVEIEDINAEVVQEMLRYIYTDNVQNLSMMAADLLAAADKYELDGLRVMCEESLIETLNLGNAAEIWVIADRHRAWQLKAHVLRFVHSHKKAFVQTEGYKKLEKAYPHLVFEAFRSSDN